MRIFILILFLFKLHLYWIPPVCVSIHLPAWPLTAHPWWHHQMEIFSTLLALCAGNSLVTGEFPAQRPVTRSFDVFLICAWTDGWVNNQTTGDLIHHRVHYDFTIMLSVQPSDDADYKVGLNKILIPILSRITIFSILYNPDLLSVSLLGTNFKENWIKTQQSPLKKINMKMSSAKW